MDEVNDTFTDWLYVIPIGRVDVNTEKSKVQIIVHCRACVCKVKRNERQVFYIEKLWGNIVLSVVLGIRRFVIHIDV